MTSCYLQAIKCSRNKVETSNNCLVLYLDYRASINAIGRVFSQLEIIKINVVKHLSKCIFLYPTIGKRVQKFDLFLQDLCPSQTIVSIIFKFSLQTVAIQLNLTGMFNKFNNLAKHIRCKLETHYQHTLQESYSTLFTSFS